MKLALPASNHQGTRRELDYYPTPPEATIALMRFLDLPRSTVIWEPASGDGSMSKVLEHYVDTVISSDIRPDGYGKPNTDYLTCHDVKCDAIITNPPFELAHKFIEKALLEADMVAMLVKSQYWHAKKRFTLYASCIPTFVLPLTWRPDFVGGERGGAPTMEVLWTVWKKGDYAARYIPLAKPIDFTPWKFHPPEPQ